MQWGYQVYITLESRPVALSKASRLENYLRLALAGLRTGHACHLLGLERSYYRMLGWVVPGSYHVGIVSDNSTFTLAQYGPERSRLSGYFASLTVGWISGMAGDISLGVTSLVPGD